MNIKNILEKKQQILAVASQYGASKVRVFGSVARGEETPESDIDFLVELAPDRTLLDQIGLIQSLEDLLGYPVDVVEEDTIYDLIKEQVLKEAIYL